MSDIILYGHRGGGDPWPDSTVESYTWGVNWGADFIEPDVYLTKDGVLVVSHDNIPQGFANVTYAEAMAMNPALLTFGQVIELAKQFSIETGRDIGVIPELKDQSLAAATALVQTLVEHDFTDPDRVVVQSFGSTNLQWLHDTIMPQYGVDFQLAYLGSGISNPAQIATFADIVAPSVGSFSAADVQAAHDAGLKVVAWTIAGAESDIQTLVDMGVDGVFVDNMQLARPGEAHIEGLKVIYGTPQWDAVSDTAGNDEIYAMQGDDILRASAGGNDVLYGDGGNDLLFGGDGDDRLTGGSGTDYLDGGSGSDLLDGSAGNDVILATGDEVLVRPGNGIDLVVTDNAGKITFTGVKSTDVTVIQDGTTLILRAGDDALVIRDGHDAAHLPGTIAFADGVTWTGAELAAHATPGTDAAVEAALPGLEYVLAKAPALATPSTIAIGTDLVADDGLGNGKLAEHVANVEDGAIYRLSFSLADLGGVEDAGVKVIWNGEVVYQGIPDSTASTLHVMIVGGTGDGSNQLVFEGAGADPSVFDASLTDVHFVKFADPGVPVPDNAAPVAEAASIEISQDLTHTGAVAAADANGDPLVYSLGDGPAHGTLTFNADGTYTYTPTAGYTGADGFTYIVNDGHGGVDEASIGLTVKPGVLVGADLIVNGSFEDLSASSDNNGPSDWGYRNLDGSMAGWTDVNHNRIEQHWDAPNGVNAEDGRIWIDMDGYNTNTHIVQQIAHVETGATYRLSFSLADADTAVSNDGIRVLFAGQLVYEGVATNPWQTFNFTVVGGSGDGSNKLEFIATGTNLNTYGAALDDVHFIKIANVGEPVPDNQAPDAIDGSATGGKGMAISGRLTATDPNGDVPLTFSLGDAASHGTVVVNADGTYRYSPDAGFAGTDSFTFTVSDGHGGTDTATQSLTIDPVIPIGSELIVNGGFEDVTGMTASDNGWGWYSADGVPGWQDLSDGNGFRSEVHTNIQNSIGPKEGTKYFDMDGNGNNARLVQTVAGVETGAVYTLSFWIGDADGTTADDGIKVFWGGQQIYAGVPKNIWQQITIDVVGGTGDGSNTLEFDGTETNLNWYGAALDNVSLVKIGEHPNLIVNGSFEDLTGANNGNWTGDWGYRNNSGIIPGWQQINTSAGGRAELHFDTQNGVKALDGNVWFDMDGNGNNAKLVQTVAGIEAGKTYELKFSIADADGAHADDGVRVWWGGKLVYEGLPKNTWQEITIDVVGGDGDGSNKLMFEGTETSLSGTAAALDKVSLRLIDENPNLIVNGSFEDLTGAYNGGGAGDWGYRNDNGIIPGWRQVNMSGGGRAEIHWDTHDGVSARDGRMWFDMDGVGNNARLVQTVAGVETGKTYDLTFSIADEDRATADDGVRVSWGGQVVYEGLPGQAWQTVTLHVVGGAGDGSNTLIFEGTETSLNGYGAALDDVSLRKSIAAPILGTDGDDRLAGTAGHDVFDGGKGDDTLTGGGDTDTYLYGAGDGSDVIVEAVGTPGTDVLSFQDLGGTEVTFHQHGQDVVVVLQDGSLVTLKDQLAGSGAGIEMVTFADGVHLDAAGIASRLTNAAPVITSAAQSGAVTEWADGSPEAAANTPHLATGAVTFTDADVTDSHTASFVPEGAGYLGTFTLDTGVIDAGNGGTVGWSFSVDEHAIDHLAAGRTLTQSYEVTVDDGLGGTAGQVVSITITGANDAPVAADDATGLVATQGEEPLILSAADLLANDRDVDGDAMRLVSVANGIGGTVVLDDHGNLVFSPTSGFAGQASFTYTVSDGHGGTSEATATLQVVDPYAGWTRGTAHADALSGGKLADRLYGDAGDDTLIGGANADQLGGGTGNDSLDGGQGDDRLIGGAGNDRLTGGADSDTLIGGSGNDSLEGGAGNDRLEGGAGADVMNGGLGQDIFVFGTQSGADAISGFAHGQDQIELHGLGLASFAELAAAMTDTSLGVVIELDASGDNHVLLADVSKASLDSHDFIFA